MSESKSIGDNIRAFRIDHDLSQDKLAELIFRSRKLVNRWENGQSIPSSQDIKNLCEVFHESSDVFIFGWHEENRAVIEDLGISDNAIKSLKYAKMAGDKLSLDFASAMFENIEWYSGVAKLIHRAKTGMPSVDGASAKLNEIASSVKEIASDYARYTAYEYMRMLVDFLIDGRGKPYGKA